MNKQIIKNRISSKNKIDRSVKEAPFFYAKVVEGNVLTKGHKTYLLGHKISDISGAKADGIFAEWEWDGKKLVVENDRYGFFPTYYFYKDNEIIISQSIQKLLQEGALKDLNYPAIAVFLRTGFYVGDDTPFKYIHTLPPDVDFCWTNGKLDIKGRLAAPSHIKISEKEAVDQYIHLFRKSMKKRLPDDGNFAVPLSGGRDSRHILLELDYLGYKPKCCVTVRPYTTCYDEELYPAQMLAEALGFNHVCIDEGHLNFNNELRNINLTNYCADEHAQFLPVVDYMQKEQINTSYDGVAGDVLSAIDLKRPDLNILLKKRSYVEFCKSLFKAYSQPDEHNLKIILKPQFYKKVGLNCAIDHLTNELKKHIDYHIPTKSFVFWNRTRREVALAAHALYPSSVKVFSPYVDYDLFDFLMSLPEALSIGKDFHTKVIEQAYPKIKHLSYAQGSFKGNHIETNKIQYFQGLAKYFIKNFIVHSAFVRAKYIYLRMIKGLVNKKYCLLSWWMAPPTLFYLTNLEKLVNSEGKPDV